MNKRLANLRVNVNAEVAKSKIITPPSQFEVDRLSEINRHALYIRAAEQAIIAYANEGLGNLKQLLTERHVEPSLVYSIKPAVRPVPIVRKHMTYTKGMLDSTPAWILEQGLAMDKNGAIASYKKDHEGRLVRQPESPYEHVYPVSNIDTNAPMQATIAKASLEWDEKILEWATAKLT